MKRSVWDGNNSAREPRKRGHLKAKWNILTYALIALLVVVPVLSEITHRFGAFALPSPVRIQGVHGYAWSDLERLSLANHVRQLPDVADYITHSAYQSGLPYGRGYTFPYAEETVSLSRYDELDGRIIEEEIPRIMYDEQWFSGILAEASETGITAMLMGASIPIGVRWNPALPPLVTLWNGILTGAIALTLLLPGLGKAGDLTAQYMYGMRSIIPRRKRQTA
jgi:hypothetical protein